MRRHLRIPRMVMAGLIAATFSSSSFVPQLRALSPQNVSDFSLNTTDPNITTSDDHGRKVYVNDFVAAAPVRRSEATVAPRRGLMYWSSKEKRWKAVPSATTASMKAAKSAAAEVNEYLYSGNSGRESSASANAKIAASNFRSTASGPESPASPTPFDVDSAIEQAAMRHNVDPNLVRAVVKVESNFNPNAVSRKGAMGLMQLMPSTARQLNVQNAFDPAQNVDAGVRHLKQLLDSYKGDIRLTLAAYNAGAGAVARSAGVPRYAETQNYVRRITNLYYGQAEHGSLAANPAAAALFVRDPVKMQRDARGVLTISNTD